jgi:hypothetical protein
VKSEIVGIATATVAVTVWPLAVAETVTVAGAVTGVVVRVNVIEVRPAGTVTEAGTAPTAGVLDESATVNPAAGAGLVRVIVPVDEVPPITEVGFITTVEIVGALIAN